MLELDGIVLRKGGFTLTGDFIAERGARIAVIGPSGAGKSTLISAIGGFEPIAHGQIRWQGRDMSRDDPGRRPVATLFQDQNLFPHLTLGQNVGLGLNPNLRLTGPDIARIDTALEEVGLQGLADRKPGAVSGGQQSRAALARITLQARDILLLDEPFAALGPGLKADMLDLVANLCVQTKATLLMVSHDPADALRICPQAVLVADGVAHAPQNTASLLADPPESLRLYLGSQAVSEEKGQTL